MSYHFGVVYCLWAGVDYIWVYDYGIESSRHSQVLLLFTGASFGDHLSEHAWIPLQCKKERDRRQSRPCVISASVNPRELLYRQGRGCSQEMYRNEL